MDFSTLEIIGLAFMSGLKISDIAEDLVKEEEKKENNPINQEENNIHGVVKVEGEEAKKIMDFIARITGEEKK
jgi:hypothetical protein